MKDHTECQVSIPEQKEQTLKTTEYIIIFLFLITLLQGCASTQTVSKAKKYQPKYNYHENETTLERLDSELKYNYYENSWSYEDADAEIKYDIYNQEWVWK